MKQTSERVTKTTLVISLHYSQMKLTNKRVNKDNCGLHYNQKKPETNHQVSYQRQPWSLDSISQMKPTTESL